MMRHIRKVHLVEKRFDQFAAYHMNKEKTSEGKLYGQMTQSWCWWSQLPEVCLEE